MPHLNLDDLDALDRPALSAAWRDILHNPTPPRMSQPFMRRVLAFEIQAQRYGGLRKATLKTLTRPQSAAAAFKPRPTLKPGGRLLREWNGITHVVDVTDDGFDWNGQTYRSLSAIARAITGAHWSGPRFFGLKGGGAK